MAPKESIVHVIHSLGRGGCETMLLRTLPLLTTYSHTVITIFREGELAPLFRERGIEVITLSQRGLINVKAYSRLVGEIKKRNPRAVFTYLFHADLIGRFVVQTMVRKPVVPSLRTTYNHPRYRSARLFEKLTHRLVPRYLANSPAVKDFYATSLGVPERKITVIPNGFDTSLFKPLEAAERRARRRELDLEETDFVLICVANLHPNKGHRHILEALRQLPSLSNLHLLVVGEGEERTALMSLAQEFGLTNRVHFLGRRSDVIELLAISDLFVFPTLFEGMSNSLLEAMAAGLPCLVSDIKENTHVLKDGQNGRTFITGDSGDLAEKLAELVGDSKQRDRLGKAACQTVEEKYSLRKAAESLNQFIASL